MKNNTALILALLLGIHQSANAETDLSQSLRSVCQMPEQQAKYWQATNAANHTVQVSLNGSGDFAVFHSAQWQQVQQILKIQQRRKNPNVKDCIQELTHLFRQNFNLSSSTESATPVITGADRDNHGCIGSAGYIWCEHTQDCERPWELAKKQRFELSMDNFHSFCR